MKKKKEIIIILLGFFSLLKLVKSGDDLKYLGISGQLLRDIFDAFLLNLDDYTVDSKGDSGSK